MTNHVGVQRTITLVFILFFDPGVNSVLSDIRMPPPPRVFSSRDGRVSMMVLPNPDDAVDHPSTGNLFRLNTDGTMETIWKKKLINNPDRIVIYNGHVAPNSLKPSGIKRDTYVVSIGTWGRVNQHPVVIFDGKGKLIRDFNLSDLVSPEEIWEKITVRPIEQCAKFEFTERAQLFITFDWGKQVAIDLPAGTAWDGKGLAKCLGDKDPDLRWRAAYSLDRIQFDTIDSNEHLPLLVVSLKQDENFEIRMNVATVIGKVRPPTKSAVHALLAATRDEHSNVRVNAIRALGSIGPFAKDAIADLQAIVDSKSPHNPFIDLRGEAKTALRLIRQDKKVEVKETK